ncbi:type IV secretion protein Rhs, partial [Dysgonomonas sp. OttesenSCG-928-D17]|nr:type IV secretion protein Rhs [Dysgonomonas sp. OttesenSCG-928-D17]
FSLPEGADYGYKISNLSIGIEKVTDASVLVINTTQASYNNKAYLHGFIQQKDITGATVYVDGKEVNIRNGSFEALVPVSDSRKVAVKAVLANGKEITKEITFTTGQTADIEYALNTYVEQNEKTFRKGQEDKLQVATALLSVEPGALLSDTKHITITSLRSVDIAALDMGMNNVTAEHKGYRFLPHGEHFADGATVTIKYDRTKIPNGFTEDDIRSYYFDLDTKHWVALERDTIDKKNQLIVSRTTHFTDMINGVIQTPESPETQGFAPTMMNDIKAADPTAKVQLIAPPTANNRGSAGLSYGFEMPPARNGMQPSLGIQYNSDGGSGWLGEGWDLSTPSISVDTRWGVPRYNDEQETETYSFNGSMLMTMDDNGQPSVAHRGDKIDRKADRQFYPRNEGSFSKIIRKGSSPADYTWEVTDKSGTKYTYDAILKGTAKTLNGDKEVAVEWKLSRVEELHGDWIEYAYETTDEAVKGSLTAKAIYLTEVRAGSKGSNAHTVVTLTSTSQKDKKTNSARYGFLTSSNKLLDKVTIAFEGETLRSYTFDYKQGAFNTNILTKINHIDSKGEVFASHDMDYYDDVKSTEGYKPFEAQAEEWNLHDDGIDAGFVNPVSASLQKGDFSDKVSALGGNKSTNSGGSLYVGVGPGKDILSTTNTGGASFSYSYSEGSGLSTLIDINGDGIPDKVFVQDGGMHYRPGSSLGEFGEAIEIRGASQFSSSYTNTTSFGAKVSAFKAMIGTDKRTINTKVSRYFTDVNGDGLPDLVVGGSVYFNHIEKDEQGNLVPVFTLSSGDTPSPIRGGGIIDDSDTAVDPQEQAELIANNPLQDAVRVWVAPYDGVVNVSGSAKLVEPNGGYDLSSKSDGVRLAVQLKSQEVKSLSITADDFSAKDLSISGLTVKKNDKIYFRVQAGTTEDANGENDKVEWEPSVSYSSVITEDPNGYTQTFSAETGNIITDSGITVLPERDTYTVRSTFVKPVTSDSLTLRVILGDNQTVYQRVFADQETFNGEINIPVENTIAANQMQFIISSSSNIAWEQVEWKPVVYYSTTAGGVTVESGSKASVLFDGIYEQIYKQGTAHTIKNKGKAAVTSRLVFDPVATPAQISQTQGDFTLTIKKQTGIIYKGKVKVANGIITEGAAFTTSLPAEKVWVELFSADTDMSGFKPVVSVMTIIKDSLNVSTEMQSSIYYKWAEQRFGPLHRSWGQFSYNAMEGRATQPIQENLLTLPQSEDDPNINPQSMVFMPMSPDVLSHTYWQGSDPQVYVNGKIISASRMGQKDVILENPLSGLGNAGNSSGNCIPGSGAVGIRKESKSTSISVMTSYSIGTLNTASGEDETLTEFVDMNGDGYPDIISKNQAQLTNTSGGFDGEILKYRGYHRSESSVKAVGAGGNPIHAASISAKTAAAAQSAAWAGITKKMADNNPQFSGLQSGAADARKAADADQLALDKARNQAYFVPGAELSDNGDKVVETYMDVNGDGLPDKILSNKQVQLNLGYGFAEAVNWDLDKVQEGSNTDVSLSLGFDIAASSWSGGIGLNTSFTKSDYTMADVNSDGLVDKVRVSGDKVYVSFNIGNSFTPEMEWKGLTTMGRSSSTGESINGSFTTGIPIPIIPPIRIVFNPGASTGHSINRTLYDLRDVDGDGYPEIVSSDEEGKLTVYRSTIARTNKLKSVNNPLGGSFTLDYTRSQATYDHPGGKWVMRSVEVNDGLKDDGANMKTVFDYEEGRHERHEREFLGFGKVTTMNIDTEAQEENTVYRKAIQQYDVNSVYTAGNQLSAVVEDAAGNKYTESVNEYYSYKLTPSADNYSFTADDNICTDRAIAFTPVKYTKSVVYEGQADGMTANESFYEYYLNGNYGDLKNYKYSDKGTLGNNGTGAYNYMTAVQYTHNTAKHIFGLPVNVQVTGSDGVVYRRTQAAYDVNYANHLTQVTQILNAAGDKAVIDIEYDKYGNITKKTLPANYKGQRMWYKYLYDRDYNMYVERVEDAFGYRSEMENYDYRYGMPLLSRDMNGYTLETTID